MGRVMVIFLLFVIACGETHETHFEVLDSAGIRIVRYGDVRSSSDTPIEPYLELRLGELDGPDELLFLQVTRAFFQGDSVIVVADGATAEFRFFRRDGSFIHATAGRGQGPGELRYLINPVKTDEGMLLAFDGAYERLYVFSADGRFVETMRVPYRQIVEPPRFAEGVELTPRGDLVVRAHDRWQPSFGATVRPGFELLYLRASDTTSLSLGRFGGLEHYCIDAGGRPFCTVVPFTRSVEVVTGPRGVYLGDTDRYTIRVYDLEGALRTVVDRSLAPLPVSSHDVQSFRKDFGERMKRSPGRELFERFLNVTPWHEYHPAFTSLFADVEGWLWVQHPGHLGGADRIWAVYDADAILFAEVRLPYHFRITDRRGGVILGVNKDRDDVEYIEIYTLPLPAP